MGEYSRRWEEIRRHRQTLQRIMPNVRTGSLEAARSSVAAIILEAERALAAWKDLEEQAEEDDEP